MADVFLSASVPVRGRGHYYESADPFLIQVAVRELVIAANEKHRIIWGGHPSITPMVLAVCNGLDVAYEKAVVLYQSAYFRDTFPVENRAFDNVVVIDDVSGDRRASLALMRGKMISDNPFKAAVFIGGMDGVEVEFQLFTSIHRGARVIAVASPGGAARDLAFRLSNPAARSRIARDVDFAKLFRTQLDLLD